jgi:hypothetical protein
VANALAVRRRKGTLAAAQVAACGLAGEPVLLVETGRLIGSTQSMADVRPTRGRRPDLRDREWLAGRGGLFCDAARTLDVRAYDSNAYVGPTAARNGVQAFVWPREAFPLVAVSARAVERGRYTCHPLGVDVPLVLVPRHVTDRWSPLGSDQVPRRIRRGELAHLLERELIGGHTASSRTIRLWRVDHGVTKRVHLTDLVVTDLSDWRHEGATIAIDPERGRISLGGQSEPPQELLISFAYAGGNDVGGGPFRQAIPPAGLDQRPSLNVGRFEQAAGAFPDLGQALAAWDSGGRAAVIQILDSRSYTWPATALTLRPEQELAVVAAPGVTPTIDGTIIVGASGGGRLSLDGVWCDGALALRGPLECDLRQCTLNPTRDVSLLLDAESATASLRLEAVVGGRLVLTGGRVSLHVKKSIVGGIGPVEDSVPSDGVGAVIERTTILGTVNVASLEAVSALFCQAVRVTRTGVGRVELSYIAPGSSTPARVHCVPADDAATDAAASAPIFISTTFGQPGYAQLAPACPEPIWRLAHIAGEPGAGRSPVQAVQRLRGMQDFVPAGIDVSIRLAD